MQPARRGLVIRIVQIRRKVVNDMIFVLVSCACDVPFDLAGSAMAAGIHPAAARSFVLVGGDKRRGRGRAPAIKFRLYFDKTGVE